MTMPKASVDKYHGAVLREDNIRTPREVSDIQAESESRCMKTLPDKQLYVRILSMNTGHVVVPLGAGHDV